ncbi:deoxyribodipyrimidine photo-lyase [Microbulbifer thermotolerans]|uniref:cryptochrome/photolyase family protein n=1 Tax=Microbulbifer thermotolerans TaxID=252514 RepID=UPI0008ECA7F0|nr:FAD-binding domain-containing protein [Microbulbifer thermotolerans]MCX2834860.1 deoxyribodipyrimidine photo-lyase [Microbulbifer thermotolerans]SFC84312.1 deoxyribodipyrimidine photo-lyase [Microbulbifer thermotolerans]
MGNPEPKPLKRFRRGLVWLRNDLRLNDNTALYRGAQSCRELAAVFIACPISWQEQDEGEPVVAFRLACLRELQQRLAERNIPLYFLEIARFQQVPRAMEEIVHKLEIEALFANSEYPYNEQRRDDAVRTALKNAGLQVEFCSDRTLLPPGAVKTGGGETYKVFTPFKRAFVARCGSDYFAPLPPPRKMETVAGWPRWIQLAEQHNLVRTIPGKLPGYELTPDRNGRLLGWMPGETAGARHLRAFREKIGRYALERDFPAKDATSRLSPYLNCGAVSIRQCVQMAFAENGGGWSGGNQGAECWLGELLWREFYTHLIAAFPRLSMHKPFKPDTDRVPWKYDAQLFRSWCEGTTGVPIVDAAMRQLNETGWMHNRLRMVVASFLTKNLLIDWRWGERYFMQRLIDADLAANNGGWQWAASTGTDSVPYFRVFNPYSQSKRFDRHGEFIRRFVPELRHLSEKAIHCPPPLDGYPAPVCDVAQSRDQAIAAFAGLRNL